MKELILLTGASSGIGYEMAKLLAAKKYDLILVARRLNKLENVKTELENSYGITVYVFAVDLSKPGSAVKLYDEIKTKDLEITILINNAGTGEYGEFSKTSLEKETLMIQLNISSLVVLTKLFLKDMKDRNYGRIMNTASILSFLPFPYFAVYAATKAFVLSFTEAIRAELSETKISVTALCPGATGSEFVTKEMAESFTYKRLKLYDPAEVAKKGVNALLKRKGTVIVGLQTKILANAPRFSPRSITLRIAKFLAGK
jgi:short-subunit dehydrogenase